MSNGTVGILGSGNVGKALAAGFLATGHRVKVGSRTPEKLEEWSKDMKDENLSIGTFDQVAEFGEILVLAVAGQGAESAVQGIGKDKLEGKIIIDATNPLDFSKGRLPFLLERYNGTSLGEQLQVKLPSSRVVKCFNTVNNALFYKPNADDAKMFICGEDPDAKVRVTSILKSFGWSDSIDMGGIENSSLLEALAILFVRYAISNGDWNVIPQFRKVR